MTFTFREAKREGLPLLIGIAGGTGSGKTMSALRLATGLAGTSRFALIDTENGRALHYADQFDFDHGDLGAPFSPERYAEAIHAADAAGYPVIVVDSFSHEYAGDGGLLDWHETELHRMAGDDWKKREAMTFAAWVKPKGAHKRLVSQLLQIRAHLVLCLRAEEKIEIVKENGKTRVVPKRTLSGHVGWIPVAEKSFAYELTTSLVLTPDAPGVPKPIKLQDQHRAMLPLDQPISEVTGVALAEWAKGGDPDAELRAKLERLLRAAGKDEHVAKIAGKDARWLRAQIAKAEAATSSPASTPPPDADATTLFQPPADVQAELDADERRRLMEQGAA